MKLVTKLSNRCSGVKCTTCASEWITLQKMEIQIPKNGTVGDLSKFI